jgi:hypothetical protein
VMPWFLLVVFMLLVAGGIASYVAWRMGRQQGKKQGGTSAPK